MREVSLHKVRCPVESRSGLIEEACEALRRSDAKVFLAFALHYLAQVHSRSSTDTASVIQSYANAIGALEEVNVNYELAVAYAECARLQEQLGKLTEARANLEKAEALFIAAGGIGQSDASRAEPGSRR